MTFSYMYIFANNMHIFVYKASVYSGLKTENEKERRNLEYASLV